MPVYHIVLFKLKPGVTADQISALKTAAKGMVGQIPGLYQIEVGPPLAVTAHRGHGFDMGLVAMLEKGDQVAAYGAHPAHQAVHEMRGELCTDTLAYDLEF